MNRRLLRFLTIAPVFVYGTAIVFAAVRGWDGLALLVLAGTALPVLSVLAPRQLPWLLAPSVAIAAYIGLIGWLNGVIPAGPATDAVAGTLAGLPLWALGIAVGISDRPGWALAGLEAGLAQVVSLKVAVDAATASAGGASVGAFVSAWFDVVGRQLRGLGSALSTSGLGSPVNFPLEGWFDPVFIALAILALGGLLLPMIRTPRSMRGDPVLPPRRDLASPVRIVPPPVLNAPDLPATDPVSSPGATLAPVLGAVTAVVGFELVGGVAPVYAFTVVTFGVIGVLLAIVLLGGRGPAGAPSRRRRRAASAPPPARPTASPPAPVAHRRTVPRGPGPTAGGAPAAAPGGAAAAGSPPPRAG